MKRLRSLFVAAVLLIVGACSGSNPQNSPNTGTANAPAASPSNVSLNKDDYAIFPDADSGADPSVPAEQGGKGFTGEGWETNLTLGLTGDPRAVKGGVYREYIPDFPGTLRMGGPEWNTYANYLIGEMVYEPLMKLDPTTLEYAPRIASHWQVSPDKTTFRFRINPNARFSDGQPVTANDVVASWKLLSDKTLRDPGLFAQYTKFELPVAESKYIVRVKAKTPDWKSLLTFGTSLLIFPASVLKDVTGAKYISDYNFKYLPGTGPYMVHPEDIQKGKALSLRRRTDYWAEKARWSVGLNNFDEVRLVVVREPNLAFEMFKKGDLDFFYVNRARVWVEEMNFDKVQRGLIEKVKVFNNTPESRSSFAMNTRRAPLDDIRVRKALTLLLNRPQMIEKLFFNEYTPNNSYYPGSTYVNPSNPANVFNADEAVKLLAEAGWKDRDSQGRLTKNGRPFQFEMLYDGKDSETILTVYQQDLLKVGITMNLRLVTFETRVKLTHENRQFDMTYVGWGWPIFPDPETEVHSRLADEKNTDNITGFKDRRIDELIDKYNKSFDVKERTALLKELDGVMTSQYHDILLWSAPSLRLAYWNKFGQPAGRLTRIGDYMSDLNNGPGAERLWWIDPDKAQKLEQAMRDSSIKLPVAPVEDHFWTDYAKKAGGN